MKKLIGSAMALSMIATPVVAAAAPENPAAKLSVGKARAGTPSAKSNKLGGGGILAAVLLAGIVAIPVIDIVRSDDDSDSN